MRSPKDNTARAGTSPEIKDEATGLPLLRSWKGVYFFVFGSFLLWVALLLALTRFFS